MILSFRRGALPLRHSRPRRPYLPRLEILESRLVPATTHTVTTLLDETVPNSTTSLREAIAQSVSGDTIDFDSTLFDSGPGIIHLSSSLGKLYIGTDVTILGPGANTLQISGDLATRVLEVGSDITVSIFDLTIANGSDVFVGGGNLAVAGIKNAGSLTLDRCVVTGNQLNFTGVSDAFAVAGIVNSGFLRLHETTVAGNSVDVQGGGNITVVGGILNVGSLEVNVSTISGNTAHATMTGSITTIMTAVGGIHTSSAGSGPILVINSTISGNKAQLSGLGDPSLAQGLAVGGIQAGGAGLVVDSSTFAFNAADISGCSSGTAVGGVVGLFVSPGPGFTQGPGFAPAVSSTIIALNTATVKPPNANAILGVIPDVGNSFTTNGNNFIGIDDSGGTSGFSDGINFDQVGDSSNPKDPLLGDLLDNGGATFTHALHLDSPAIDKGSDTFSLTADQRGFFRPVGNGPDIGSFEFQDRLDTTTAVIGDPESSFEGDNVLFTATVNPQLRTPPPKDGPPTNGPGPFASPFVSPGLPPITGTVQFIVDGIPQLPVPVINGIATLDTSSLSAGPHTVTANYSGDDNYVGSSGKTQVIVVQVPPPPVPPSPPPGLPGLPTSPPDIVNGLTNPQAAPVDNNRQASLLLTGDLLETQRFDAFDLPLGNNPLDAVPIMLVQLSRSNASGSVGGRIFEDANGDGFEDTFEQGLQEVAVYLDLNKNGQWDEGEPFSFTDEKGQFHFYDLTPGTYVLRPMPNQYFGVTAPEEGAHYVTVLAGQNQDGLVFGLQPVRSRRRPKSSFGSMLPPSRMEEGFSGQQDTRLARPGLAAVSGFDPLIQRIAAPLPEPLAPVREQQPDLAPANQAWLIKLAAAGMLTSAWFMAEQRRPTSPLKN